MKTKKIWFGAVAAIALVAMIGLGSAFKPIKPTKSNGLTVQQWYSIIPTTATDLDKQTITSSISAPPLNSSTDCAQSSNFGNYCGVLLSFNTLAPNLNGKTVQQAITLHNATIVTGTASAGYSRLP